MLLLAVDNSMAIRVISMATALGHFVDWLDSNLILANMTVGVPHTRAVFWRVCAREREGCFTRVCARGNTTTTVEK